MSDNTQTHEYSFDVELFAAIKVRASSIDAARRLVREGLDGAAANFGAWPDGDPILADVGLFDGEFTLTEIDGTPMEDGQ